MKNKVLTEVPVTEIHEMHSQADAQAFRTLNEEWIQKFFRLEDKDRFTLGDPEGQIVAKGGHVYIAQQDGKRVGCVALVPYGPGLYELSKMAVAPAMQGRGIGRQLLQFAIGRARQLGATRLFLGSHSTLGSALRLYEAFGFRHASPEELPPLGYARANVHMLLDL